MTKHPKTWRVVFAIVAICMAVLLVVFPAVVLESDSDPVVANGDYIVLDFAAAPMDLSDRYRITNEKGECIGISEGANRFVNYRYLGDAADEVMLVLEGFDGVLIDGIYTNEVLDAKVIGVEVPDGSSITPFEDHDRGWFDLRDGLSFAGVSSVVMMFRYPDGEDAPAQRTVHVVLGHESKLDAFDAGSTIPPVNPDIEVFDSVDDATEYIEERPAGEEGVVYVMTPDADSYGTYLSYGPGLG